MKIKTPKQLKAKLWEQCKHHIRLRDGNTCFTCGKVGLTGSNQHTGHFIPSASGGAVLRYHPDNLKVQCYNCNINLGGNGAEYYRRMILNIGNTKTEMLFSLKNKSIKADSIFYMKMIELYEAGDEKAIVNYLESF